MGGGRKTAVLCSCGGGMALDDRAIAEALGEAAPTLASGCAALCRQEIGVLEATLAEAAAGDLILVACAQEGAAFEEAAEAAESAATLRMVDIRDRAGWAPFGADARRIAAKQAAYLADALSPPEPAPVLPIHSEGRALIYAPRLEDSDRALAAAERLAARLGVTLILHRDAEPSPKPGSEVGLATGRLRSASGRLGAFSVTLDSFAEAAPMGRGARRFGAAQDGARTVCDILIDLSGGAPLFAAHHKRDGYLRVDPTDALGLERALFDATDLVGAFEKPLYIRFEESLCAHSRAKQPGCDRCLNLCPTGAITPNGDHVAIDPHICAGCGACAAVCPTGAAAYDDPAFAALLRRMTTLAETYARGTGGERPRLLIHDAEHGREMIALLARHGDGLPEDVIALELSELGAVGHAGVLAALALGFDAVDLLLGPKAEATAIKDQLALAEALAAGVGAADRLRALELQDPDALGRALQAKPAAALTARPARILGEPRKSVRASLAALNGAGPLAAPIDLSGVEPRAAASYGAVVVDAEACTLCLACVSLCPTGALLDNPDRPELRFQEDACVQCGVCANACPESAITLAPRFNLADDALRPLTLHQEEPFACIECGKEFGVKSTILRVTEKLAGVNWMYTNSDNVRLIQMCDDCRVTAQYHQKNSPFFMGERPAPRTTADALAARDRGEDDDA